MILNSVAELQVPIDLELDSEGASWSDVCCYAEVELDGSSDIGTIDKETGLLTFAPTRDIHIGLHKFFVT